MKILDCLKNLLNMLTDTHAYLHSTLTSPLHLEELNTIQKSAILRIRGSRATLRLSIAEAVTDPLVISNLMPSQACCLGYYAGQLYDAFTIEKKSILFGSKETTFKLHFKTGRYKIISQNRKGAIEYIDTHTNEIMQDWPLRIASTQSLIAEFDPSQACYIGVLAAEKKHKAYNQATHRRVQLRVVK